MPSGYIYIIQCSKTPYYKIGRSRAMPLYRLSALQAGCPYELLLVCAICVSKYKDTEREIHEMFKARRVRGEWFQLTNLDLFKAREYLYSRWVRDDRRSMDVCSDHYEEILQ